LREALAADKRYFWPQRTNRQPPSIDEHQPTRFYQVGYNVNIVARAVRKLPDGKGDSSKYPGEGIERGKVLRFSETE